MTLPLLLMLLLLPLLQQQLMFCFLLLMLFHLRLLTLLFLMLLPPLLILFMLLLLQQQLLLPLLPLLHELSLCILLQSSGSVICQLCCVLQLSGSCNGTVACGASRPLIHRNFQEGSPLCHLVPRRSCTHHRDCNTGGGSNRVYSRQVCAGWDAGNNRCGVSQRRQDGLSDPSWCGDCSRCGSGWRRRRCRSRAGQYGAEVGRGPNDSPGFLDLLRFNWVQPLVDRLPLPRFYGCHQLCGSFSTDDGGNGFKFWLSVFGQVQRAQLRTNRISLCDFSSITNCAAKDTQHPRLSALLHVTRWVTRQQSQRLFASKVAVFATLTAAIRQEQGEMVCRNKVRLT